MNVLGKYSETKIESISCNKGGAGEADQVKKLITICDLEIRTNLFKIKQIVSIIKNDPMVLNAGFFPMDFIDRSREY